MDMVVAAAAAGAHLQLRQPVLLCRATPRSAVACLHHRLHRVFRSCAFAVDSMRLLGICIAEGGSGPGRRGSAWPAGTHDAQHGSAAHASACTLLLLLLLQVGILLLAMQQQGRRQRWVLVLLLAAVLLKMQCLQAP